MGDNYKYAEKAKGDQKKILSDHSKNEATDDKRTQLLKKHGKIEKILKEIMGKLEADWAICRREQEERKGHMNTMKMLLQDSYVLLKYIQEKLKEITTSIKITETSLLDMASLVNYEQIQVDRFIIDLRN